MRRFTAVMAGSILALCLILVGTQTASAARAAGPGNPATVSAYAHVLRKINPHLPVWQSSKLAKKVLQSSIRWGVDANILVALVSVESAWRTHARSHSGAIGLGQLMPGTARTLHVNPRDPYQNLQGSAHYLGGLLARYQDSPHRYSLAFAAYNAGPKAVSNFGGIPPYYETQHYVVKVMSAWNRVKHAVHAQAAPAVAKVQVTYGSPDVQYWSAPKR
jgi:soluble lytic murein transglycosylase-like protein